MRKLYSTLLVIIIAISSVDNVDGSSINKQVGLAITIYNDRFAMVKDTRSITFDQGRSDLFFTDVSSNIETQTVTFKAVDNPQDIKVFEQNYEANLVNTEAILKKYIEKEVNLWVKLGDQTKRITGTLLSHGRDFILQTQWGIESYNSNKIEGIQFAKLPDGFFTKPTLNWKVFSKQAVTTDCEVAYRTTGFRWKADYTVILGQKQKKADVGGWVTINNWSGKKYENTKLKLIAGDVNAGRPRIDRSMMLVRKEAVASAPPPTFSQKSFSDFHMYTLSQTVTLNQNSQKQVEFIPKVYGINVRKYYVLRFNAGGRNQKEQKASNYIDILNSKANNMGMALPKGTVRVFKQDTADGSVQFIGEDSISHTPRDEKITLVTGNAFDISADKIAKNRRSFTDKNGRENGYMADLELSIRNHKDIEAEIVVEVTNYRGDNVRFNWNTQGVKVQKVSASLYQIKKVFKPNQKILYKWSQNYRA